MRTAWQVLAARIDGIAVSASLLSQFLQVTSQEQYGVTKAIGNDCADALAALVAFAIDHQSALPPAAVSRIADFNTARSSLFHGARSDAPQARAAMVLLVALKSELSYLLADKDHFIRSRTELALMHLQRSIAIDKNIRTTWLAAFNDAGETGCERLGAVHFLAHGIFAFKAHANGGRTDLIYAEPVRLEEVQTAADGMVLTEWKVANADSAARGFATALAQAKLYSESVLAGLELASYRYLIAVSEDPLPPTAIPPDQLVDGVVYRAKNIALKPASPSVAARAITRVAN